ncbi:MAG: FAD-binding oxidoreductase [Solirubrobacterales bacterium]
MAEPCREVFPGARVERDNPRYPTMVQGFNPRWIANPDWVQVCGDTEQVVATVQEAFDEGKRITVRSGGHCYENFVCENEEGVLIDLSPMNGVYLDQQNSLYCVEGGATLWNVYNALYREYGRTLPGGSCYPVGAGGHFTGGGYGLLSRLRGLTTDYLAAVEVVRVNSDGKAEAIVAHRDASDPTEQKIAWAHRGGGGGNFGIVTRFWFEEPPRAPELVLLASLAWNWSEFSEDSFAELIENFGEWHVANSAPDSEWAPLFALLHLNQNSSPSSQIALTIQVAENEPELMREFQRELTAKLPAPVTQRTGFGHFGIASPTGTLRVLPWLSATQQLDGATPNQRGKYKSAYMNQAFPPHQIEMMWKYLHEEPNAAAIQALLQVDSYGCQVNAHSSDETAVAQRSSVMKLQYQTYWYEEGADEENLAWIRAFYNEMYGDRGPYPDGTMDGCFVNYPDVDLQDWQYLYYKDNYPALREAKSLCDPHNVFHHQQSIEPL